MSAGAWGARPRAWRAALVLIAGLAVVTVAASHRTALWRAAYPFLPRPVQALPYRLRDRMAPERTPLALPAPRPRSGAGRAAVRASAPASPTGLPRRTAIGAPADTTPSVGGPTPQWPLAARLPGGRHEYQTWNNCGPATVSMALGRLGALPGQAQAATRLKPDPNDKNVSPEELARYARERGFGGWARVGGNTDTLRGLVATGIPVIVETWFIPTPGDEMGHYRLIVGYDDARGVFQTDDSYNGPGVEISYAELDRVWRVFNRAFVAIYPTDRTAAARRALGELSDDAAMYAAAAQAAERELVARPDAFGYFNLGSSLLGLGDAAGAAGAFDMARALGLPWRMLWYQSGPFEAYARVGRWADVEDLAAANLVNAPNLEESRYWLGRARQARGDLEGARREWKAAVDLNPLCEMCSAAEAAAASP